MPRTDPMNCTDFLDRYSDYDDSLVPPEEAAGFRAHMAECPACARYDRVLRKGRMLARQLPPVEPSDAFVPRLRTRLWAESGRPSRSTNRAARLSAGAVSFTVLLVLAVAASLLGGDGPEVTGEAARPSPAQWLPVAAASGPAPSGWSIRRVASERPSSYSPLITGPPAYRGAAPRTTRSPTHLTLD